MTNFNPLITGVIQVTGPHDVGKTTFALECGIEDFSRLCIIDDDEKTRATVEQLREDYPEAADLTYIDFTTKTARQPQLKVFDIGTELIESLKPNQFDVLIWDTWSRYASTFKSHVRKNSLKFREARDWAGKGSIKGGQEWKEAQWLEAEMIAKLQQKAPLVFLVTHLKDQYIDDRKSGKQVPDASRTLNRVPRLRLWLLRNPTGNVIPVGLVLKRIDRKTLVPGKGLRTIGILPEKIVPDIRLPEEDGDIPRDQSLWDTIGRYMQHPFSLRDPLPEEIPDKFERSVIDGTLTEDLKRMWMLRLQASANGHGDEEELDLPGDTEVQMKEFVTEMRDQGASDNRIAHSLKTTLNASYPEIQGVLGMGSVSEVVKMVKEGKGES